MPSTPSAAKAKRILVGLPGHDLAADEADPAIGDRRRRHENNRGKNVVVKADPRHSQQKVDDVIGKNRNQPQESNEAPALRIDAAHDPLQPGPGAAFNPVAHKIARDQEREDRAQASADKIEQTAEVRAEHRAADDVENAPRNHENGRDRIDDHKPYRRPDAETGNPFPQRIDGDAGAKFPKECRPA